MVTVLEPSASRRHLSSIFQKRLEIYLFPLHSNCLAILKNHKILKWWQFWNLLFRDVISAPKSAIFRKRLEIYLFPLHSNCLAKLKKTASASMSLITGNCMGYFCCTWWFLLTASLRDSQCTEMYRWSTTMNAACLSVFGQKRCQLYA